MFKMPDVVVRTRQVVHRAARPPVRDEDPACPRVRPASSRQRRFLQKVIMNQEHTHAKEPENRKILNRCQRPARNQPGCVC